MRRDGHIIEEITAQENLEQAFDTVVRGTYRKSIREGRWLVQFRDTRNGQLSKFFTDCDEMKSNLETLSGMGEIPFATTIEAEYFGDNKVKYKFT